LPLAADIGVRVESERVRAAMATQVQIEGRYLGGRPPYGYQLADLGPPVESPSNIDDHD
jgi:hypothetical protein